MPAEWLSDHFGDDVASRELYPAGHHLPMGFEGFLEFYETRRKPIRSCLAERLGHAVGES
jgi:hypothetical protein